MEKSAKKEEITKNKTTKIMLHLTGAKYIEDYKIWVAFDDNSQGIVDLSRHLKGEIFKPLKNKKNFAKVKFDPESETIAWPNGADLAPEFLRKILK